MLVYAEMVSDTVKLRSISAFRSGAFIQANLFIRGKIVFMQYTNDFADKIEAIKS